MILKLHVDDQTYAINVPRYVIEDGEDFFAKMDRDLDKGYQMSRTWVDDPDTASRCRIAADRILTALHTENEKTGVLMAGYILSRMPGITGVRLDTSGDMCEHELILGPHPV